MNWYYVVKGRQAGPVTDEQLAEMLRTGKIFPTTMIWREGMPEWQPCGKVKPGLVTGTTESASDTAVEAVCAECGKLFPMSETVRYGDSNVCAACKPVFLQRKGGRSHADGLDYAGFWIRFAAKVLDGLILGVVIVVPVFILIAVLAANAARHSGTHAGSDTADIVGKLLGVFIQFAILIGQVFYSAFFLGKYGATPGKMVCGLVVVDAGGDRVSYGRAFGRAFAELLSGMICSIGYIIAALDNPQKRALHDRICHTRVIHKNR